MTTQNEKSVRFLMARNLVQSGLFEEQAEAVMAIAEKNLESMQGNWGKDYSGYPHIVLHLAWTHVLRTAVDWAKENVPEAWFIQLLEAKPSLASPTAL